LTICERQGYTVAVPVVFDQEIHVHYGQFYVESRIDNFFEELTESRGGQANGLCGAAVPGLLFLTTGLHTGRTRVSVEVLDAPAPVSDEWEDVVEASFRPATTRVALVQWAGEASWPLPLATIDYRVRYVATGMDRAHQRDTVVSGEPLQDRYLLQFWPAPPAPDEVIRETSRLAAYWHSHARTLPSPPTPQRRAAIKEREQAARERDSRDAALAAELRRWGGRLPAERVRRTNGVLELARAGSRAPRWDCGPGCDDAAQDLRVGSPAGLRGRRIDRARLGESGTRRTRAGRTVAIRRPRRRISLASGRFPRSWYDRHFLRRPARTRFSATHGRTGTLVGRGRGPAGCSSGVAVPRRRHRRNRLPEPPVRSARGVP
jgi:hypothetical protein